MKEQVLIQNQTAPTDSQKICEGCLGGAHCIECFYLNTSRRSGSYAYCEKHKSWHRPDDYYCSQFSRK